MLSSLDKVRTLHCSNFIVALLLLFALFTCCRRSPLQRHTFLVISLLEEFELYFTEGISSLQTGVSSLLSASIAGGECRLRRPKTALKDACMCSFLVAVYTETFIEYLFRLRPFFLSTTPREKYIQL